MRIALVGDVHGCWDERDRQALDSMGYDLVVFIGDLGGRLHRDTLDVARRIATLRTPALLVPGNHDATTPIGVLCEAMGFARRRWGAAGRHVRRLRALELALGPVRIAGYTVHAFPDHGITFVAGRPHAMDGDYISFSQGIEARYGVKDLSSSIERLTALVDATSGPLVFLGHNGPHGLGAAPDAPFSLLRDGRDLGDRDLAHAIHHARSGGRSVLAVLAGHLHHDGSRRRWCVESKGTLYVNAARVPRAFAAPDGRRLRHHVEVRLSGTHAEARAVLVPEAERMGEARR